MLNNNHIQELGDLLPLEQLTHLNFLSLIDNPVVHQAHYKSFVVHKCPFIRILDFTRITEAVCLS